MQPAPAPELPADEFAPELDTREAILAEAAAAHAPTAEVAEPGAAETGDTTETPADAAPDTRLRVLVIDAAPYGVDPVVGEHVSAQLRETAGDMGYAVASRDESVAAAQSISMPFPPSPADLWRVTWAGHAQRGLFARVWAQDGRYVTEIMVASMDGAGPFFARGTSGAEDLHAVVDALLRQALPAPERWDAEAAARYSAGETDATATVNAQAAPGATPATFVPVVTQGVHVQSHRRSHRPTRRFDLAVSTEAAIGTGSSRFYNHLVGARLDLRITTEIMLGIYAGYANLRGRDGRVQNMLFYIQGENRIRLGDATDLTIPLRFSLGYVPFNGPFVRISAGLNLPISERVELGIDLIAPTFWVIPGRVAVSADIGLELLYRL